MGTVLTVIGTLLVAGGLYRRDPGAQRGVKRALGWISRHLLRRPPKIPSVGGAISVGVNVSGEGFRPPLAADPSKPLSERTDRLEENIEILSDTIQAQAKARREGDRELAANVKALRQSLEGRIEEVRRLADEASIPERMEWWGLGFLLVGAALSLAAT